MGQEDCDDGFLLPHACPERFVNRTERASYTVKVNLAVTAHVPMAKNPDSMMLLYPRLMVVTTVTIPTIT